MDEDVPAKMVLLGMIPLGGAPAPTLVAVEEIFLPVVETLEAVDNRLIPTPRQMAIRTPRPPIRGKFLEDASSTVLLQGMKSIISGVMSWLSIFGKNARVSGQPSDRRNQRN